MSTFTNPEYDKKYLTISKISGINKAMKKLQTKITNQKTIDVLSYIALSFAIIFALGFLLFFIYGIASAIVFTTLVPLVIFGASVVCLGLSVALFGYFFNHKIKKEKPEEVKTKTEKVTTWSVVKDYITFANVALALVIIGAVLLFTSIAFGSIKKPSWRVATASFKQENGYYNPANHYTIHYFISDVSKIDIDLKDKNVVVIYDNTYTDIVLDGYELYEDEVTVRNIKEGTLYLAETESPRKHEALDNMFWFIFTNNKYEAQIRVYIPTTQKDNVTIVGDYILAKE